MVRVHVKQDNYYNDSFDDESEWACYKMNYPDEQTNIYGYSKRGSIAHAAMETIHRRMLHHTEEPSQTSKEAPKNTPPPLMRVTLQIKRSSDANDRQYEITNVISDDWVISDLPFDERLAEQAGQ
ncbi:hypothetical protein [Haloferula sp.]|uniref:hypothetical protein n=1 Tax=Haloferula sp. TaxID=2497595 RepID=UPI00329BF922